jgi:CDP-paratose synthetase
MDMYSLSKAQFFDWLILKQKIINIINIKIHNIYGKYDSSSKLVTYIIDNCLKMAKDIMLTPGNQKRNFIYIDDVIDAYLTIMHNASYSNTIKEYKVGSGDSVTIRSLAELIKHLCHSNTKLLFGSLPYRENEVMHLESDLDNNLRVLGWKPRYTLEKGINEIISSYTNI